MKWLYAPLLAGLTGCGTIIDIAGRGQGPLEGPNPHIFGGVRYDWDFASTGGSCCRTAALAPCFLFDLPLSAALDVVLLPITVPVALFPPKRIKLEQTP